MHSMLKWLGSENLQVPLVLTAPHSGEKVPQEAPWLKSLSEQILLTDVDRFVDQLYLPAALALPLPLLVTDVHRYAADLNRYPDDVDRDSVLGSPNESGKFPKGFHWTITTQNQQIMPAPIAVETHNQIVANYHDQFHEQFQSKISAIRKRFKSSPLFHLDCHSMPSVGTGAHSDQGSRRPDVVVSDFNGKSSSAQFKDLVIAAYSTQGLNVSYNWPYQGGRITQRYGKPDQGHHTLQIELNRALYMDEGTKQKLKTFSDVSLKLKRALELVVEGVKAL